MICPSCGEYCQILAKMMKNPHSGYIKMQMKRNVHIFLSLRSDQNALSILFYQFRLIDEMWPIRMLGKPGKTKDITLFLIDREYIK